MTVLFLRSRGVGFAGKEESRNQPGSHHTDIFTKVFTAFQLT
jgi:hypothetical protein